MNDSAYIAEKAHHLEIAIYELNEKGIHIEWSCEACNIVGILQWDKIHDCQEVAIYNCLIVVF